jgi:dTDP-4-dehydrorhamnose reductase
MVPLAVDEAPPPSDDYGRYKVECEKRVCSAESDARIVRIGRQIAFRRGGNQRQEYIENTLAFRQAVGEFFEEVGDG